VGRTIVELKSGQTLFCQGEPAGAVYYLQRGKVKIAVLSKRCKEATIALLSSGSFMGEECIAGPELHRKTTAMALTTVSVLKIERGEIIRGLREEQPLCEMFIAFVIARNARIQKDLVDQLFNSSEKRLARALLLLAQFGNDGAPETVIPKISPGNPGRNGGNHPIPRQLLHEPLPQTGLH
jgi:CRP/FNR family transcriptional regulator, cyclic AMP receptor protein